MPTTAPTSYDAFPYPAYVFPQTHPDRLAAIAVLLGLSPPKVETCRVLELGCASGSNLIPMAEELPEATFVGIDLSQRQVAEGERRIGGLGLRNLELRYQSILDFEIGSENFDYILCHGVYSWVPSAVQDRILEICRRCLHPDGIAYISYNTLPGWHMRGMIRDMMLYHSRRCSEPRQKVAQARALLDCIAASVTTEHNPYGQFLRSELDSLCLQPDSYLFHDHLEEYNTPLYFHRFVEQAVAHDLHYLADIDLPSMEISTFPSHVREILQRLSSDMLEMEQYMDFIRNRSFRQSLLCHARHRPKYRLDAGQFSRFYIASPLRPSSANPDLQPSTNEQFKTPAGAQVTSWVPIVKAALTILAEEWPRLMAFADLFSRAWKKIQAKPAEDQALARQHETRLAQTLLQLYATLAGVIELRLRPLPLARQPENQPTARPLARWQARFGNQVTNLRHETVVLTEFGRQVLQRLDGQCSQAILLRQLSGLFIDGQLTLQEHGAPVREPDRLELLLQRCLDDQLRQFSRQSLLQNKSGLS